VTAIYPNDRYYLGLWDGHDSGAALARGNEVIVAINEERLTRRKLEVLFPRQSIMACLEYAKLMPADIKEVAYTTTDFAKTLTRNFPALKEEYYRIRRRKTVPSILTPFKKSAKYRLTQLFPSRWTRAASNRAVRKELSKLGFHDITLHCVDHHAAHAAGAYFSGFESAAVLTLDGIGDGFSGAVYRFEKGRLDLISTIPGASSLGIFYEHVTNLMNMRELEDEGKVMALSNLAYPVPDDENPMLPWVKVHGMSIEVAHSAHALYHRLKEVYWQFPSEQFCYMAQRTLERRAIELVQNVMQTTGLPNLVFSGGVASNIKVNRLIRNLPEVKDLFVFPHMGDGGQAAGAAVFMSAQETKLRSYSANNFLLGPSFDDHQIESVLKKSKFAYERSPNIVETAAQRIAAGQIVFWFQGRMEYGPRALGARSILALPNSVKIRDDLNLKLKKRVWYQPFCPSMLEEDAQEMLEDFLEGSPDRYMNSAYMVKESYREKLAGILGFDGTCRPQIVKDQTSIFGQLLLGVKRLTGVGALLNTSMNIHGQPLVCSPTDALRAFEQSGGQWLMMGGFSVKKD
jgi:carbamoyltransferase